MAYDDDARPQRPQPQCPTKAPQHTQHVLRVGSRGKAWLLLRACVRCAPWRRRAVLRALAFAFAGRVTTGHWLRRAILHGARGGGACELVVAVRCAAGRGGVGWGWPRQYVLLLARGELEWWPAGILRSWVQALGSACSGGEWPAGGCRRLAGERLGRPAAQARVGA
eukprot:scaffold6931_cov119-Isochrysis_galbana.AAC.8